MPYTRSQEAEVWWDSTGDGSPIVLINGLSSPSVAWFRLVPLLAPQHRVLTLDNLGTGRTRARSQPHTMAMLADAVADVIAASGEPTVHVLGISLGGLIAQQLTLERPRSVSSLTLVSTHAGAPHMVNDQDSLAALSRASTLGPEERNRYLTRLVYAPTTPQERIEEDMAVRAQYPTSEQGYADQLAGTREWERLDDLHTITCPTLIVHGENDRLVSPRNGRSLREHIPGAQLAVLPDCGHQLFTDQPEAGAGAVLKFLAAVDDAAEPGPSSPSLPE